MYQFLDRAVTDLALEDRLILQATRHWVAATRTGRCPCAAVRPVLGAHGCDEAVADLHMAMLLLDREGMGRLAFRPIACARITDDEALLMAMHLAGRTGATATLEGVAALLCRPEACGPLATAVGRIAAVFRR